MRILLVLCLMPVILPTAGAAVLDDAVSALRIATGARASGADDLVNMDVEEAGPSEGRIDLHDAIRLVREAAGLDGPTRTAFAFSFEHDTQGWAPAGTDLDDPPVAWSITRSTDRATDGTTSLRFALVNYNDAGKIWMQRPFRVLPDTKYQVTLTFDLATSDYGTFNLWRIIAGASAKPPVTRDDLQFQGETGNGADSDVGFVWLTKTYTLPATSGSDGWLWVYYGIWGTWESPSTYYVDNVRVTLAPSAG